MKTFTLLETNQQSPRVKKKRNPLDNITNFYFDIEFPLAINDYSQSFEYSANLTLVGQDNITSYDVLINGLYFGSNIFNNPEGVIKLNVNDVLTINNLVKIDNTLLSKFQLAVQLV